MSNPTTNLCKLISETTRVFIARPSHFFALSSFFLFPISVSSQFPNSHPILQLLHAIFLLGLALCAAISITHSVFHGFYERPIKIVSSLKPILVSFFPLLATILVTQIVLGLVTFAFMGFTLVAYNVLLSTGLEMDYDSYCFLSFVLVFASVLFGFLVYLQMVWCLATAVVVLESESSFGSLRRSCVLVQGVKMEERFAAFFMVVLIWFCVCVLSLWCSSLRAGVGDGGGGGWPESLWVVVQGVGFSVFFTVFALYAVGTNVVLFLHCKTYEEEQRTVKNSNQEMGGVCATRAADEEQQPQSRL